MRDGALINTVEPVSAFAFAADGQTLATGEGNIIQLWRVNDAQPIAIFEGPSDWEIRALDFAPDGQTLAAATFHFSYASDDADPVSVDQIHLWRVRDGALLLTIDGAGDVIDSLAFAPDGKSLASASSTNAVVRSWKVSDGALLIASESVFTPAVAPHNYYGYTSQLWWTPNSSLLQQLYGHSEANWSFGISMSGFYSEILRSFSQSARLRRMSDGTLINSLDHHSGAMEALAFSPDGTMLAAGASDGSIRFWRTGDFAPIRSIAQESEVVSLAFSRDAQYLASSGGDGNIRLWRVSDGVLLYRLDWQDDPMIDMAFSPDGQILATAGNEVQLWRVTDGTWIRTLQDQPDYIYGRAADFSADGKTIAAASWSTLNLWRTIDDAELWAAEAEEISIESINAVAFAPDGKTLAVGGSGSSNGRIGALIDLSSGRIVHMLKADRDEDWWNGIMDLAFSPDGQILAAYAERGDDRVVYLWEAGDGALLRSLEGHRSFSTGVEELQIGGYSAGMNIFHSGAVAFSPDGRWLASASADGTVIIWAVLPPEKSTQMISDTGEVACALRRNQSVHLSGDTNLWSTPDVSKASIVFTPAEDSVWKIGNGPEWGKITAEIKGWWWEVRESADGPSEGWVWEGRIRECQ